MISPDKIDEWIREVEERPASAELIIRYIARRLSELAARDEELVAQNIELLSGRKVEEYESRIASLEYQLELLKRQIGGELVLPIESARPAPKQEMVTVVVYNLLGQVLRFELNPANLTHGQNIAKIQADSSLNAVPPALLAVPSQEELLFIFDSGRTVRRPAAQLPLVPVETLDWHSSFLEEPRGKEELVAIQPITRLPLYELCIQASRRGFVKTMKTSFFTSHLEENYIGSGVKVRADKPYALTLANKDDLYVMVSQEGYIFSMRAERLPTAIEEVIKLGITDHIVSAFIIGQKSSIIFITQNGKAVHREAGWLEAASSYKSKGQAILSKERRDAGIRIVGASPADEGDWGAILQSDGNLSLHKLDELLAAGSMGVSQPAIPIIDLSVFHMPVIME